MAFKSDDQRLIMRVLSQWRAITVENAFPRRAQIDPLGIGHDWSNCVLIDLAPGVATVALCLCRPEFTATPSWPKLRAAIGSDCLEGGLLHLLTAESPPS